MLHSLLRYALWLLLCLASLPATAETVRLGEVTGNDLTAEGLEAVRSLIESELIQHPKVDVVDADSERPPDAVISANVTRWGESYVIVINADFSDGSKRSRNYRTASDDEIDVAISRLVVALVEDTSVSATAERGAVLESEQKRESRVLGDPVFAASFGAAWPFSTALDSRGSMYDIGAGLGWDLRDFIVELRTNFLVGSGSADTFAVVGGLGCDYLWLNGRRFAVYSGIEAGFAYMRESVGPIDDSGTGFVFAANTGVMMLRFANVNLDLRFRVRVLADRINDVVPVIGALTLGVRF